MRIKNHPYFRKIKLFLHNNSNKQAEFSKIRSKYYDTFWKNAAASINAETEGLGDGYLRIRKGELQTFVKNYEVEIDNRIILQIAGNKDIANKLMLEKGFPVPKFCEFTLNSIDLAKDFMSNELKNFVIKPARGAGGRGVTMGISSPETLNTAIKYASMYGNKFLIEEEIHGSSYRLLYLNAEFIDAIRRDPPSIIGDGFSSIKKLIEQSNYSRLNSGKFTALSPLVIDDDLVTTLKRNSLSLSDIPVKDSITTVKSVINQNSSFDNHIVRDKVHPDIIDLGSKLVKYFDIELAGIDIIADTLEHPLEMTGGAINEINTTPGLHHHDLVAEIDDKIMIGERILNYIFSKKSN